MHFSYTFFCPKIDGIDGNTPHTIASGRITAVSSCLSTMEITADKPLHEIMILACVSGESAVVEITQAVHKPRQHRRREDAAGLINFFLALKSIGALGTICGQMCQTRGFGLVFLAMDIYIDIGVTGKFLSIGVLEPAARGHSQSGKQQINVG